MSVPNHFCQLCSQLGRAWKQKQRVTEKDGSFRKTSRSWLGEFGGAKTLKRKKAGMNRRTESWSERYNDVSALNNGDSRTAAVVGYDL